VPVFSSEGRRKNSVAVPIFWIEERREKKKKEAGSGYPNFIDAITFVSLFSSSTFFFY
jgi:hypothetical protein